MGKKSLTLSWQKNKILESFYVAVIMHNKITKLRQLRQVQQLTSESQKPPKKKIENRVQMLKTSQSYTTRVDLN